MPTIGSIINGGQGQVVARVPGGAPGTTSYLVRNFGGSTADSPGNSPGTHARPAGTANSAANVPSQLSTEEKRVIAELQARDRAVRNEEERHAATAGQYAGEPQYTFRRGPDGKMYAVEGKVPIRLSAVSGEDQEKALRRVQAAAVSVQSPSSGDFAAVAASAASLAAQESGPSETAAEKRQEADRAYRAAQERTEASDNGTQDAAGKDPAGLAREIFGAIAAQQV